MPTLVFGFRIKDAERARRQLDEVHSLVRNLLDEHRPELSAHLQRDQIAGHEFLTLRLDGSMIPWDEIREEAEDVDEEQFDKWREADQQQDAGRRAGRGRRVCAAFRRRLDRSSGNNRRRAIPRRSAGDQAAREACRRARRLDRLRERRMLAQSLSSPEQTVEDLAGTADELLRQAEIDEEQRKQLVEDIRALEPVEVHAGAGRYVRRSRFSPTAATKGFNIRRARGR